MYRICIYPADVQLLTGRSANYSRKLISAIKRHNNKQRHQFVTLEEFCAYTALPQEIVFQILRL